MEAIEKQYGAVDILINNAGTSLSNYLRSN